MIYLCDRIFNNKATANPFCKSHFQPTDGMAETAPVHWMNVNHKVNTGTYISRPTVTTNHAHHKHR